MHKYLLGGKTNLTNGRRCGIMIGVKRYILSENWFWVQYAWKGEIILRYHHVSRPHYNKGDFDNIHAQLIRLVKDQENEKNVGLISRELRQTNFSEIYYAFEYHKPALSRLFELLDTEQRERFRKVIEEILKQHELIVMISYDSNEDLLMLLEFLKEIPGRLHFVLKTLVSKKTEIIVSSPPEDSGNKWSILEGKPYVKVEETQRRSLFFGKRYL